MTKVKARNKPGSEERIRTELRRLGDKRRKHEEAGAALRGTIGNRIFWARVAGLPATEIAQLLGIDRSTLYRVHGEELAKATEPE